MIRLENIQQIISLNLLSIIVDEFKTARGIRTSATYSELKARGAVFGERMGWERPLYFNPHHNREDPPEKLPPLSFGKPEFFEHIEVTK